MHFYSKQDMISPDNGPDCIWDSACSCSRDPASLRTNCLDARPESWTQRLCGTRLLSEVLQYSTCQIAREKQQQTLHKSTELDTKTNTTLIVLTSVLRSRLQSCRPRLLHLCHDNRHIYLLCHGFS